MKRMLFKCLFIFDVIKDETIKKEIIQEKYINHTFVRRQNCFFVFLKTLL